MIQTRPWFWARLDMLSSEPAAANMVVTRPLRKYVILNNYTFNNRWPDIPKGMRASQGTGMMF